MYGSMSCPVIAGRIAKIDKTRRAWKVVINHKYFHVERTFDTRDEAWTYIKTMRQEREDIAYSIKEIEYSEE